MHKILIVDDEAPILELFRFVFDEAGYEVALAKNGRQALESISARVPDFIILDIDMPVMSGREFITELKLLRELDPAIGVIPFVVMTGQNFMNFELNKTFSSTPGFVCFFPKMIPPNRVLEKAIEVINQQG